MDIIRDLKNVQLKDSAVAIGKFDGLHLGHKLLFDEIKSKKKEGQQSVVLTFVDPVRSDGTDPSGKNIFSIKEKREILRGMDMDVLVELPFTKELSSMDPNTFVKDILSESLGTRSAAVGEDFRFGHKRAGDVRMLKELGKTYGFSVSEFKDLCTEVPDSLRSEDIKGECRISSTLIRKALLEGEAEFASSLLGRDYFIEGIVKKGKGLGRTMDMPTINMSFDKEKLVPREGVYASVTVVKGKEYFSVTNIGRNPTVKENGDITAETFLWDFSGDLYDENVMVIPKKYLRGEQRFGTVDELKEQMQRDMATALRILNEDNK